MCNVPVVKIMNPSWDVTALGTKHKRQKQKRISMVSMYLQEEEESIESSG